MKIYKNVKELIGNTPLLELTKIEEKYKLNARILAKIEFFNPGGSVKDRIANALINKGIQKGLINNETTLIEPTSGNTGIGIAMIAARLGLKVILTMPETMSIERRQLLSAYGANLVLTDGKLGMNGAINEAKKLNSEIENSVILSQFTNKENPKIHKRTTAPEIWKDTMGTVDIFIAGVGTGGTITGVSKYLRSRKADIKIYAVEPLSSPVLSGGEKGPHKIQGIGAGFIPEILDTKAYDDIIKVSDEEAFEKANELAKTEGLLVGISSGAALAGAIKVANMKENKDKVIVCLFPDTGERYLSSELFD